MNGDGPGSRLLPIALGIAVAALGLIGLYDPSLGLRFLGGGLLLNTVGFVAIVLAGRAVWIRARAHRTDTVFPDVTSRRGTRLPGHSLDTALEERREAARDRLREAAFTILYRADTEGTEIESTPESVLSSGSWTDDPRAAAFFDANRADRDGLLSRFQEWVRATPTPQRRAAAVVDELGTIADVTWGTEDPGSIPQDGDQAFERLSGSETLTRPTGRYLGMEAVPLAAVGAGIFGSSPALLLLGAVTALLLGVARAAPDPPTNLAVEHRLEQDRARPGETVRVTLAVTNEADRRIFDLRLVDRVPSGLRVTTGRPTIGTTLAPGETVTATYAVETAFGEHDFCDCPVILRDFAGATEVLSVLEDQATLTCLPTLSEPSTLSPPETTPYAGQVDTKTGGVGIEFFGTRAYRHGDAISRVDWKRFARTGELTTIEYREERAASVVVLIDARASAYVGPTRRSQHAVARSVEGAATLVGGLLDDGDRVGLAGLSTQSCWVPPGAGSQHRAFLRTALGTHPAFDPTPPPSDIDAAAAVAHLRTRLQAGTTVVFLTPLLDDWPHSVVQRLRADGLGVAVVSPDPTSGATVGTRLARIERAFRLSALRSRSVSVVDWGHEEPLELSLARRRRR